MIQSNLVHHSDALIFLKQQGDKSINLALIDPPYFEVVKSKFDHQWKGNQQAYIDFMTEICLEIHRVLTDDGSLVMFGCNGSHNKHVFWKLIIELEKTYFFRDYLTWAKKKFYGCKDRYGYANETLVWLSKSDDNFTFNIPYTGEKRGYQGWNKKYPAKSEYKRVTNVIQHIAELFRTRRETEKPLALLDMLIRTHTNSGNKILDCFVGSGSTMISAINNGREFVGCDSDPNAVKMANERLNTKEIIKC